LPDDEEALLASLAAAQTAAHNRLDSALKVTTGEQAYGRWLAWLEQRETCTEARRADAVAHARMAEHVIAARESAMRFLQRPRAGVEPPVLTPLGAMIEGCRNVAASFQVSVDPSVVEDLLSTSSGLACMRAEIENARKHDVALWRAVDGAASQLK
jgi:hypothetical protein